MLWKFCKDSWNESHFYRSYEKFIFLLSFLDCFHIQYPSGPMSIYISAVFTGEISKYSSTFET